MKILAIDSATEHLSVAYYDGNTTHSKSILGNAKSSSLILPLVQEVLQQHSLASLDMISYTTGPGAFTSMRVGIGVVQALALAHHLPTCGFSSLQVLEYGAQQHYQHKNIISAIDARMDEIYVRVDGKESLIHPEDMGTYPQYYGVGTAFATYGNFAHCQEYRADFYPLAENLIHLTLQDANPTYDLPTATYLRNNVAQKSTT